MFKIEKDVPMPLDLDGKSRKPTKYPFRFLEVGDSFLIPADDTNFYLGQKGGRRHPVQNSMGHYTTNGRRFASRMQDDGSLRVWRVK